MSLANHQNWRLKATLDSTTDTNGIHYTSIQTLSEKDFNKIKKLLMTGIEQTRRIIEPSTPEQLVCMNLDFFKV